MVPRSRVFAGFAAVLGFAACGAGEVTLTRFKAFDPAALNAEFTEPTGEITQETVLALLGEDLSQSLKFAAKGVGGMLAKVLDTGDGNTTGTLEAPLTVTSSNAYIRLSCPGPSVDTPNLDFLFGEVRIDAPGILPSKAALKAGDVLLTFSSCIADKVMLAAKTSAYYDVSKGFIFELDVSRSTINGIPLDYDPMKLRIGTKGLIEVLVEIPQGSYVVDVAGLPGKLSVRGSNTKVECQLQGGKATCSIGGKEVTFDLKQAGK